MNQPLVSVIMVTYNAMSTIEATVNCIVNQTYKNWELIVSDDASPDGTGNWLKQLNHPQIKVFVHEKNIGYIKNKNFTFQQASGDLLTQLDGDDLSPLNRLELQVNAFQNNPDIKIVGGNFRMIDMQDTVFKEQIHYDSDFVVKEIMDTYPFWFPNLMFKKEIIEECGLFNEYFIGLYGDDHYWTLCVNKKYPIYFIKELIYDYRYNMGSITNIMDNPRKSIVPEIVSELKRQQVTTGTDWLEEGKPELLLAFEQDLLSNKKLMSQKYRIWAAKAVDVKDFPQARKLMKKAFLLNPFNRTLLNTAFYYVKRSVLKQ